MNYEEFYYSIDCKFPYHDESEWKKIIHQSIEIGDDAPFLVLHEICRKPSSEKLSVGAYLAIYEYWKSSFLSPIQDIVESASLSYINKTELTDGAALEIMNNLVIFPKAYNALQVVLFSCPDDEELVDARYDEIISTWAGS